MIIAINNDTCTNVILSIDGTDHLIKSDDQNLYIKIANKPDKISVKRAECLPAPDYKKMLGAEILGGLAALLMEPIFYVLDVSSTYDFNTIDENLTIRITRKEKSSNSEALYDAIAIDCAGASINKEDYCVENKTEVLSVFEKCQKVSHFWMCFALVAIFSLVGIVTILPLLLALYWATKFFWIKIIMFVIPFLIIGFIMLIGVLPLHFLFKFQNRPFYRSFESDEIRSCLINNKN